MKSSCADFLAKKLTPHLHVHSHKPVIGLTVKTVQLHLIQRTQVGLHVFILLVLIFPSSLSPCPLFQVTVKYSQTAAVVGSACWQSRLCLHSCSHLLRRDLEDPIYPAASCLYLRSGSVCPLWQTGQVAGESRSRRNAELLLTRPGSAGLWRPQVKALLCLGAFPKAKGAHGSAAVLPSQGPELQRGLRETH